MASSFTQKKIRLQITLAAGQFGAGQGATKIVEELQTNCIIAKPGMPSKNECRVRVYGMLQADMEQIATLGFSAKVVRRNLLQVFAGESDGLASVFQGEIVGAWLDYTKPPQVFLELHAMTGVYSAVAPAKPVSLKGPSKILPLMETLSKAAGFAFENGGVEGVLDNPYVDGDLFSQLTTVASSAQVNWGLDDNTVYTTKHNTPRVNVTAFTSPSSGMVGAPLFDRRGMAVKMLFNPNVRLGGALHVEGSTVKNANGVWRIHGMEHHLDANDPAGGQWFTIARLTVPGYAKDPSVTP